MSLFLKTVVGLRQKVIMNDRTVCDPDVEKRPFSLDFKVCVSEFVICVGVRLFIGL